jgi:hypothetical protein
MMDVQTIKKPRKPVRFYGGQLAYSKWVCEKKGVAIQVVPDHIHLPGHPGEGIEEVYSRARETGADRRSNPHERV